LVARLCHGTVRGHAARVKAKLTRIVIALAVGFGTGPAVPAGVLPGELSPGGVAPVGAMPRAVAPGGVVPGGVAPGMAPAGQDLGDAAAATGYRWPLAGNPTVTRRFDPPARRWLPGHRGVDLAGSPGAVVRAAGAGVVAFAGFVAGTGVVSIDHTGGLRTTYQPLAPAVSAGDRVAAGDPIGVLDPGHAGCPVPACLHWGVRQGQSYLDPLSLLGLGRLRLLPRT